MGVDEGGLQLIDIEEVIILLYSTYSPVVALMVFAFHTILHL